MTRKEHLTIILILGALATISPFSIDMYLPGFPAIAADLNTSIANVQLSLTSYFVGIAAGQLLYGPLLDRFGRKLPLYAGLTLYVLASVGCAFVNTADSLIAMRFVQAVGGCVGMVAAQALVRDIYPTNKTAQVFSLLVLVISVSPMVAPTVGGYVTAAFGWHSVFIILAPITALIMVAVYFFLPEGRASDASISLKPRAVLSNFWIVLRQPQFIVYTLAGGIATAAPFAYIAGSADVFMNIYGVSEQQYGWIFAFIAFGMIASPQLNHILLRYFKSEQLIHFTLWYQSLLGIVLVAGALLNWFSMLGLIALIFVFFTGQGLTNPNATALSLAPFTKHTGSAAALLGSFRMAMGGLTSAVVSVFHNGTVVPMVTIMAACALAGLLLLYIGNSTVRYRARKRDLDADTSPIL
jgi:MFS transporter, DHA1 family, multidrug resistance protein